MSGCRDKNVRFHVVCTGHFCPVVSTRVTGHFCPVATSIREGLATHHAVVPIVNDSTEGGPFRSVACAARTAAMGALLEEPAWSAHRRSCPPDCLFINAKQRRQAFHTRIAAPRLGVVMIKDCRSDRLVGARQIPGKVDCFVGDCDIVSLRLRCGHFRDRTEGRDQLSAPRLHPRQKARRFGARRGAARLQSRLDELKATSPRT